MIISARRSSRVARRPNRPPPQCATPCELRALEHSSQAAIFGRGRTQPRGSKREGRGAMRGDACALLQMWHGGCAHSHEISTPFDVGPLLQNWPRIVRRLDVASPGANNRVQHAGRATHTRCRAHAEWRPARARFALAPRRAGRHFGGGCAAQGRRSCCWPQHRAAALWSTTRTANKRFAHQLHGF